MDKPTVSSVSRKDKESEEESSVYEASFPTTMQSEKAVTFGSLKIRSHNVVLGEHPCCASGCPLELSWDHLSETEVPLDEYESSRVVRKTRREMRTTWQERREILSQVSDGDLRRATRKLQRTRRCQKELSSFFIEA
jgi:hypothetical protein